MVTIALKCPYCNSENVGKFGIINGKQRYVCNNTECSQKTFYAEYTYKGCTPEVRLQIIKMSIDGSGTRAIARVLGIAHANVLSTIQRFGKISKTGFMRSEISTNNPRIVNTSATKVLRYPASAQKPLMVGYFFTAF